MAVERQYPLHWVGAGGGVVAATGVGVGVDVDGVLNTKLRALAWRRTRIEIYPHIHNQSRRETDPT